MVELTAEVLSAMRERLFAALHCPICGLPMVHSRLRGYHCHFEEHNERARALERADIRKKVRNGR